jgi:hypothetical protein
LAFSWLLGQPIKDTLCGTKVLWRSDSERTAANRNFFGDFDPFGDFDLLFGAAKLRLKIVDVPIRYRERTYGTTNIQRWRHGWLLLRMVAFGARRLDTPETSWRRRDIIAQKRFVHRIYEESYSRLARAVPAGGARVLEIGARVSSISTSAASSGRRRLPVQEFPWFLTRTCCHSRAGRCERS